MVAERTEAGKTADAGYQIGVRRTVPASEERVWAVLLSPAGLRIWLGGVSKLEEGTRFSFRNGISGEIRVNRPWSHLRLTWQRPDWEAPSYLQVRVLPARTGATLSFHQDHLRGPAERKEMKAHWEQVVERLSEKL
ncbi:MAG: SRPBCC family protein [Chloroflexota bacterium]